MASTAPLSYGPSSDTAPYVSASLPSEVITCLQNARFLHLATCDNQVPHVSLMNYTYMATTPFSSGPSIIMTTNQASKKTDNLFANPQVSLLVHDWVSHRPPIARSASNRDGDQPPTRTGQSSLAQMLANINSSALSRISTTITGDARILEHGSEEEKWCKEQHLQNNTFGDPPSSAEVFGTSPADYAAPDGGRGCFIEDEAVRVVVVKIKDGRISDWKGRVQDWSVIPTHQNSDHGQLVNGI